MAEHAPDFDTAKQAHHGIDGEHHPPPRRKTVDAKGEMRELRAGPAAFIQDRCVLKREKVTGIALVVGGKDQQHVEREG